LLIKKHKKKFWTIDNVTISSSLIYITNKVKRYWKSYLNSNLFLISGKRDTGANSEHEHLFKLKI